MKRMLLIPALLATLLFSIGAVAQYGSSTTDNTNSQGATKSKATKAPLKTLKGTVKAEGDKVTFVTDKDQKSWDVMNPEKLKAHDGHHVRVKAHVYSDKDAIHVMSVSMLKGKKS